MRCYAVLDTNVIVSALLSSKADAATVQVLQKLFSDSFCPVISKEIMAEYTEVLHRAKFHFSPAIVEDLLFAIEEKAEYVILEYPIGLVDLNDGSFEVLLIKMPRDLTDWQKLLHSIRFRDYGECPLIEITQAQNIWVDNPEGLIWALDGENSGETKTAAVSVLHSFLKLKA